VDQVTHETGNTLLSGIQALVHLPLMQSRRDRAAGLRTAGFITGYRGSPLGGLDQQLWRAKPLLDEAHVLFSPGVNEDLAATAVWGTQQVNLLAGAKYDGVFALWYGKGPGVDRSGDPIKHGNRMGTSPHGGVLLAFGDDHAAKSSTVAHQSEQALAANGVPVLYPATVQEILDLGLYGWALSRFAGVWVGLKCVNETVETTATACVDHERVRIRLPEGIERPKDGVHARLALDPVGDDIRLTRHRLPLAQAFVHANGLDRIVIDPPVRRLGIVSAGKSFLDVMHALRLLGLGATQAAALGIGVYKPAMIWPLEPSGLRAFARGYAELLFVEEKLAFMEPQAAHILYNLPAQERPRLSGKTDPQGSFLLPADVLLEPIEIARVVGRRLVALGVANEALEHRLRAIENTLQARRVSVLPTVRTPYFCSGCPHNISTKVPDGSLALSGIGCHTLAIGMNRNTLPPTHMGGEGMTWAGMAPFTKLEHVFQNLGDGTYFHSGLLAIRAAVAAGINITYKILFNDAVAMTGGQPVEGELTVADVARQLAAERVRRIAIVTDEPRKYAGNRAIPAGVSVHPREDLELVQRELRAVAGVTAIIYDQTCATEKRRRRKRGRLPEAPRRVFINERVCEGCGDCSVQSNCVSIQPLETAFGRKRRIDQGSCNMDLSCVRGFCPAFVLLSGTKPRARAAAEIDESILRDLPPPPRAADDGTYNILITGIGGSGVVTVAAVLGRAAHLEGAAVSVFDMTGLAQKGGAVASHLRIARSRTQLAAPRIGFAEADLILGCDVVVTAGYESLGTIDRGRTRVLLNSHLTPTARFQLDPDIDFREHELIATIESAAGAEHVAEIDATRIAERLLGDSIGTNMVLVGFALQRGALPIGLESLEEAIRQIGTAVPFNLRALALGRLAAHAPEKVAALLGNSRDTPPPPPTGLDELVAARAAFLEDYQNAAYASRYRGLVDRARNVERQRTPGRDELAKAVARSYFRLLARKDEYEVARLYSDGAFKRALADQFEGMPRISVLLSPPLLAPRDRLGRPRKIEFGPWIFHVFRMLARLRFLRDTRFDPFGYTEERRTERRLIEEYEALIEELLTDLREDNHALAVELASLPERIRGFGHVKARQIAAMRERQQELLKRWREKRTAA